MEDGSYTDTLLRGDAKSWALSQPLGFPTCIQTIPGSGCSVLQLFSISARYIPEQFVTIIANIRSPARLTASGRLRDEPPFSNSVAQHALTRIRRNDAWTCCRASATFESHHQPADALAFMSWGQQIESCCAHESRELAVDRSMFRCETDLNHKRHHSYVAAPAPE